MQGTENPAPTPAPPLACIPAYSHRQVMDWSLVLASQGIEAVIEHSPETGAWRLLVEPQDQARALAAIRLYRAENRGWAWRQRLTWPGLVFHWGASGMVMGGLGMLAVQSVFLLRESPKAWKQFVSGMLGGCMLFVLVGLNPSSDVVAHAGGFVAGLVLGLGLALLPARWARETRADQCAGAAALVWFATTWALALLLGHTPAEMHGPIP